MFGRITAVAAVVTLAALVLAQPVRAEQMVYAESRQYWETGTSGDTITVDLQYGDQGFSMAVQPLDGAAIPDFQVNFHASNPVTDQDQYNGLYYAYNQSTNTFTWEGVEDITGVKRMWIDSFQTLGSSPFDLHRQLNPLVDSGSTQTVRVDLTVTSPLTGYNFLNVTPVDQWNRLPNVQYNLISSACSDPNVFSVSQDGWSFSANNVSQLGPGTYTFTSEIQVTGAGPLASGALYHKPQTSVTVGNWSAYATDPNTPGPSIIHHYSDPNVAIDFLSSGTFDYTGGLGDEKRAVLDAVVEKVGAPVVTNISAGRFTRKTISDLITYSFSLDVDGRNIVDGSIVTPQGQSYALRRDYDTSNPEQPEAVPDPNASWSFNREAPSANDLYDFTAGVYQIHLTGSNGATFNTSVTLGPLIDPNTPTITRHDKASTTDTTPTITWDAPPGTSTGTIFELWNDTVDEEFEQLNPASQQNWFQVTSPLDYGGYSTSLAYVNSFMTGTNAQGIPYQSGVLNMADSYFNVVPGPVPASNTRLISYSTRNLIDYGTGGEQDTGTNVATDYAMLPVDKTFRAHGWEDPNSPGFSYYDVISRSSAYHDDQDVVHHFAHSLAYGEDYYYPVHSHSEMTIAKEIKIAPTASLPLGTPVYARGKVTLNGVLQLLRHPWEGNLPCTLDATFGIEVILHSANGTTSQLLDGTISLIADETGGSNWAQVVYTGGLDTADFRSQLSSPIYYYDWFASFYLNNVYLYYLAPVDIGEIFSVDVLFTADALIEGYYGRYGAEVLFGDTPSGLAHYAPQYEGSYGFNPYTYFAETAGAPGQFAGLLPLYGNGVPEPASLALLALGGALLLRRRGVRQAS